MTLDTIAPAVDAPVIVYQQTKMLECEHCGWCRHELNKSQTAYVCGCGEEIKYIVNDRPAMWAIV